MLHQSKVIPLLSVVLFAAPGHSKEALLKTTANPAIEQGYVATEQGQVHYWKAGSGPVLLLVHQSSSSVEEFAGVVPYLANRFRLVTYDWPGHGSSDDPTAEPGVDEFTDSAVAVLDHLGIERLHVLGHHGGALVAMNLAWKYPERVDKLILSGTSGLKPRAETEKFAESLDLETRYHLERDGKSISDAWGRYIDYMPESAPEEILIAFMGNMVARVRPYLPYYSILKWDRRPALESLKDREVLLMQGDEDRFVSHQENLLELLPMGKRVVIEGAGAFLFFEKPEEAAQVVSGFLATP